MYKINSPILHQPLFDFDNNHATFPFDPLTFGGFVLEASVNLPRNNACNGISITFTMCQLTQELLLPRMPILIDIYRVERKTKGTVHHDEVVGVPSIGPKYPKE